MIYFAYGSNLDLCQMRDLCPDSRVVCKAVLKGYKLEFTRRSTFWECGVADIVKDSKQNVWGLLFEISKKDLVFLDKKEGYDPNRPSRSAYRRIDIEITGEDDKPRKAITYEVVSKNAFIPPSDRYINIIKKACQKWGFPEEYAQYLSSIVVAR